MPVPPPRPGTQDKSFAPPLDGAVYQLLSSGSGLYVAGSFENYEDQEVRRLARLNHAGRLDANFESEADTENLVGSISPAGNNGLYAEGLQFLPPGAKLPIRTLLKIDSSGNVDTGFNPNGHGIFVRPTAVLGLGQNKVLAAGSIHITHQDGTETRHNSAVFRFNGDGSLDSSFEMIELIGQVLILAETSDGNYAIGGNFREVNGAPFKAIAMANTSGDLDLAFNANANVGGSDAFVRDILPLEGGSILIGGGFLQAGGEDRRNLAQLFASGFAGPRWGEAPYSPNDNVLAIARQNSGKIIIGGEFGRVGEIEAHGLARFHPNGQLDTSFRTKNAIGGRVLDVATQSIGGNQYVVASGTFTHVYLQEHRFIARFHADDTRPLGESVPPIEEIEQDLEEPRKKQPAGASVKSHSGALGVSKRR